MINSEFLFLIICLYNGILLFLSNIDKKNIASQMEKTLGQYIKKIRTKNGLTLTQLAAQIDMDSANLSKIENSKRSINEKRLEKFAHIFDLDIDNLKAEYYSELIAKKIYQSNCIEETLMLAEQKVKYLKNQSYRQGKLSI
jgi:HTH-type transcriptional regulator, competence development regulator